MDKFCPVIWKEDSVPEEVRGCEVCGLYRHGTRMVWGEGSADARIMVILDNPGARESREGEAYVCGTRQTLQKAAFEVSLSEKDLYVTYILKRRPIRAYDKPETRALCMMHLRQQLDQMRPSLIFCLGNAAVQSFFDNPEIDVKSLRGGWHEVHGFPVAVSYHPLAIRRRPNLYKLYIKDWQLLYKRYTKLM
ncbi:MAG TPA: uracil-DNA glycosylase [Bacillales bacterium]|nr:uracil-DNA glycosylase [Bacillales bacterium]